MVGGHILAALGFLPGLDARLGGCAAVVEPIRLIAGFDDMAVMSQAVQQRRGHFGIAEDTGPFPEGQIRRDYDAGMLIQLGQQVE